VALRGKTVAVGAESAEQWSATLAAALARNSASPTVQSQLELAHAYYSIGILDKASDLYETVARREPRQAAAWDGLARIWRDWGYPQLGLGDAHRAVWADPRSPVALNTLGTILQLLGKSREAKKQFARAASLDPGAAYPQYNLGLTCMTLGQFMEAAESFERAAALDASLDAARVRAAFARSQAADAAAGKGGSHERR
jgi:tetratricopeptide (TPR) repeat protein